MHHPLGSGNFGEVSKGEWHSEEQETVEVAIKTLKRGSSEEDTVRFLQEAAIMGQFRHPNIVELLGIITLREPVSGPRWPIMALNYMHTASSSVYMSLFDNILPTLVDGFGIPWNCDLYYTL